jgi:hypothetical protein
MSPKRQSASLTHSHFQPTVTLDDPDDLGEKVDSEATDPIDPNEIEFGPQIIVDGDKFAFNLPAIAVKHAQIQPARYSERDNHVMRFGATVWGFKGVSFIATNDQTSQP